MFLFGFVHKLRNAREGVDFIKKLNYASQYKFCYEEGEIKKSKILHYVTYSKAFRQRKRSNENLIL